MDSWHRREELVVDILSFLDGFSLFSSGCVCQYWRELTISHDILWEGVECCHGFPTINKTLSRRDSVLAIQAVSYGVRLRVDHHKSARSCKIVVAGHTGAGKSSLIRSFTATENNDVCPVLVRTAKIKLFDKDIQIIVMEKHESARATFLSKCCWKEDCAAIFVADATDATSLDSCFTCIQELCTLVGGAENFRKIPSVLLINKIDRIIYKKDKYVRRQSIHRKFFKNQSFNEYLLNLGIYVMEASAHTGDGVDEAFLTVLSGLPTFRNLRRRERSYSDCMKHTSRPTPLRVYIPKALHDVYLGEYYTHDYTHYNDDFYIESCNDVFVGGVGDVAVQVAAIASYNRHRQKLNDIKYTKFINNPIYNWYIKLIRYGVDRDQILFNMIINGLDTKEMEMFLN
eukprot:GHVL01020188.1.p1 GENE.GHVL01020188.1~~GHVL01020188.1.p1  ORF type:complete len:400 (-),score=66.44 GHVL01020188.1:824-2023(-)